MFNMLHLIQDRISNDFLPKNYALAKRVSCLPLLTEQIESSKNNVLQKRFLLIWQAKKEVELSKVYDE
jgi:hypothetical protein